MKRRIVILVVSQVAKATIGNTTKRSEKCTNENVPSAPMPPIRETSSTTEQDQIRLPRHTPRPRR